MREGGQSLMTAWMRAERKSESTDTGSAPTMCHTLFDAGRPW